MLPASGFLSSVHRRYRTPFNATVFVGLVTLAFELDTITKFVNFGALTALNVSLVSYFFIRRGRRSGRDLIFYLLFPLLGFLIIFYVWPNFDAETFLFGALWLAVGIITGAVKTKGFRERPAVIEEL
jgi:amino acid transporter